jgi:4-amino-4-deoxy-L-arabinose transferase-like glycosyltransferase
MAPADSPKALVVLTAAALGLWLLSTGMLAVGSATHGLLRAWFWWPVIGAGVLLAAWFGRKSTESWSLPRRFDGRSLIWIILAAAIGLWIAGATRPPAVWEQGFSDEYDVLEYHLQVPREFYDNQHVGKLPHNCYSHYPLGLEMLFLLAMCLRGGAYEGVFLAKFIHGMFAALSVAAVFGTLKREDDLRARFSAALLATTPLIVYMTWLGMVELAEVSYLTLALLWLRQWMRNGAVGSAVCLGAMLGGACAVKYLSVGFVVAPVLLAMFGVAWRRASLLRHVAAAAALAAVLFSPWLLRNVVLTGNPVFPLATNVFGRGHWSQESQQRWADGHNLTRKPPVPPPADWQMPPQPSRAELFYHNFLMSQWFGPLGKLLTGLAICVLVAGGSKDRGWDWALAAIFAVQLAVWAAAAPGMPPRFVMPALAPMSLLAGGLLAQVARIQANPFNPSAPRPAHGPWGVALAVATFVAAAGVNLAVAFGIFRTASGGLPAQGLGAEQVARLFWPWRYAQELPQGSRILLVGEAKALYLPAGTMYATAFDEHPLAEMARRKLSPQQMVEELRATGVTHLWVDWLELLRLSRTYGYPAALSEGLPGRLKAALPPRLEILERLRRRGMTAIQQIELPSPAPASSPATASGPAGEPAPTAASQAAAPKWPMVTIYALPPSAPASAPVGSGTEPS